MTTLERFDNALRPLAMERYREFERELGPVLTRFVMEETVRRFRRSGILDLPPNVNLESEIDKLVRELSPVYGRWLARNAAVEDVAKLCQEAARHLATLGALKDRNPTKGNIDEIDSADALAFARIAAQESLEPGG